MSATVLGDMLRPLVLTLALFACKERPAKQEPPAPPPAKPTAVAPDAAVNEMPPAKDITPLVKSSNNFGLELWKQTSGGNLAISPASISIALAMTWAGAKADTAEQMRKVMHLDGNADAIVSQWALISNALQTPDRALVLKLASRLYGEKHYKFDTIYFTITRKAFNAPLDMVDFIGAPEQQRIKINHWVAEQTADKIKNLLPPGVVTADTRLVIVNAIYFLADWAEPFEKDATSDQDFYAAAKPKKVPTMHRTGHYRIAQASGASLLELPYKGDSASMYILLPDKRDGLAALERTLEPTLKTLQAKLANQTVAVALPKFTIDPPSPIDLARGLMTMGMSLPFDREKADFTGIAQPADPKDRLFISAVLHKAFVKVDEKGTEAAAATAVMVTGTGMPEKPISFVADHPFIFLIVDKQTGMILFLGRLADPGTM